MIWFVHFFQKVHLCDTRIIGIFQYICGLKGLQTPFVLYGDINVLRAFCRSTHIATSRF